MIADTKLLNNDRAVRRETALIGTMRDAGRPFDIVIADLSVSGFRAKSDVPLAIGDMVAVSFGTLRDHEAVVVRHTPDGDSGFSFVLPITQNQVFQARPTDTVVRGQFAPLPMPTAGTDDRFESPLVDDRWPRRTRALFILTTSLTCWLAIGGVAAAFLG